VSSIKRILVCSAAALVTAGLGAGIGSVAPADSAMAPVTATAAAKKFSNCTALNKTYKYGVKKSSSTKNVVRSNGRTIKKSSNAKVSKSVYNKNTHLDRDKDGIACER
jgi:Excalibur calcium-binding domain